MTSPMITLKRGDRLPLLRYALLNPDGTAPDLTAATVVFNMVAADGTAKINRGPATVEVPNPGEVGYAWALADTDTTGDFSAEFEVTFPGGKRLTYPNDGHLRVRIVADLG